VPRKSYQPNGTVPDLPVEQQKKKVVEKVIEYYGARRKIEAGFKELKQDIGSAETRSRNPYAVMNHLHFSMMAISFFI